MAGNYSKIDRRMRGDKKFRRLSRPQPNAQSLWHYLLCNQHQTGLPGIVAVSEGGIADENLWTVEQLREPFGELFREGMAKADFEAGVVVTPNAIKYDPPDNANVVKGWVNLYDRIPECDLKDEWIEIVSAFMTKEFGDNDPRTVTFRKLFVNRPGNGYGNGMSKGMANPEPEPEPEPEQEQEGDARARKAEPAEQPPPVGVPVPGFPPGLGPDLLGPDFWPKIDTFAGPTVRQFRTLHGMAVEASQKRGSRVTVADACPGLTLTGATVSAFMDGLKDLKGRNGRKQQTTDEFINEVEAYMAKQAAEAGETSED